MSPAPKKTRAVIMACARYFGAQIAAPKGAFPGVARCQADLD
jgi:hypothetical protein